MVAIQPVKVEIHSERIDTRAGEKDGRRWARHKQAIWVYMPGEPYPKKCFVQIPADDGKSPIPLTPGIYEMDLSLALSIGRYEDLELDSRLLHGSLARICDLDGQVKKAG